MKVLIACECSGIVREAFRSLGHDAWSCDLKTPEDGSPYHILGDALSVAGDPVHRWELMIAHPPCTYLAISGARWFKDRIPAQNKALEFVRQLMAVPIPMIAIENPVSVISTRIRKPDQIVHPWQFGHGESKTTCLWLKNLPKLVPTDVVEPTLRRVYLTPDRKSRSVERARTYPGIASAMARQWGGNPFVI